MVIDAGHMLGATPHDLVNAALDRLLAPVGVGAAITGARGTPQRYRRSPCSSGPWCWVSSRKPLGVLGIVLVVTAGIGTATAGGREPAAAPLAAFAPGARFRPPSHG